MKLKTPLRLASALPLAILTFFTTAATHAQGPLVTGLDHIPVMVRDVHRAQADFRAMGFSIKPGRFHADGIQNAHVKFPDGTEIELITATNDTDELTEKYLAKMKVGESPVYFGLYIPFDTANVVAARVEVRKLSDVEKVLKRNGVPAERNSGCGSEAIWVAPKHGHQIWIEFAEPDVTERAGTPAR